MDKNTLVLAVSQSGETADTLAALREGKSRGLPTVAITNNGNSTMAREGNAGHLKFPAVDKSAGQDRLLIKAAGMSAARALIRLSWGAPANRGLSAAVGWRLSALRASANYRPAKVRCQEKHRGYSELAP